MALLMNDTDMKQMLESIRPEGETYQGEAWGTLMSGTAEMLALGALSNVSCYVGVTEKYRELHMRTKTNVSGYFSSLLETMGEADQALVCDAMKKLSQALSEEKDGE